MTHTYPIPNTSAAIQAARDALDAIEPAVQQDIRDIVASLIEAGDIPAARRAVNEAAATASSASDVDNIVVAQEQIRVAEARPTPAPALAAEPRPAVVRETVVVHDEPTPDVAPVAAPAATGANNDEPGWLRGYDTRRIQPLVEAIDDHETRIANLEDAVLDDNGHVRSSFSQGGLKKGPALAVLLTVWLIGYIITGAIFGWFSWPAWVIAPVIALLASAVTVLITNNHRRTRNNQTA